jgi:hypothetical protein
VEELTQERERLLDVAHADTTMWTYWRWVEEFKAFCSTLGTMEQGIRWSVWSFSCASCTRTGVEAWHNKPWWPSVVSGGGARASGHRVFEEAGWRGARVA